MGSSMDTACFNFSFSRMRSKSSRFTGGLGLRVCSLDVAFTFATVRNRPQPFAHGKFSRRGGFKCLFASFRVAGVALRDIQTCFVTVSKVVCCGWHNTFATFSEDALQFLRQTQHFGRPSSFRVEGAAL